MNGSRQVKLKDRKLKQLTQKIWEDQIEDIKLASSFEGMSEAHILRDVIDKGLKATNRTTVKKP